MPIRKKGRINVKASPDGTSTSQSGYTFYSYDKDSAALYFNFKSQNGEPTDLVNARVQLLLIFDNDNNRKVLVNEKDIEILSAVGGQVKYVIPENFLSYEGQVTGYIYLEFPDKSHTDEGQFTFNIKRSVLTDVLPASGEEYIQDFEEIKEEVQKAADQAKKDMQKSVDAVKSDYDKWKPTQEKKQSDFEAAINKKHTDFENGQKTWQTAQEKKQTDFETSVNNKHKTLDGNITALDKRVTEANSKLENLDAYTKSEVDSKLKSKASTDDVAKKADKTEVDKKASQADLKKVSDQLPTFTKQGTRTFIKPAADFANFHDETNQANSSVWLQYIVQGSIGMLVGTVKNVETIPKGTAYTTLCRLPNNINIIAGSQAVCVSGNSSSSTIQATVRVLSSLDAKNKNKVDVSFFRNETGLIEAPAGTRMDICVFFIVAPVGG